MVEIDYSVAPPADWPQLREVITYVDNAEALDSFCRKQRESRIGCSVADFVRKECRIFLADKAPALLTHERAHCAGRDHYGETSMRDGWELYKLRASR